MMTSRERILTALDHQEPDRVPIDFGAMRSTGIMAVAYNKLRKHLGIEPRPILLYDTVQQLAYPDPEILERFQADVVELVPIRPGTDHWKEGTLTDGTPCLVPRGFSPVQNEQGDWEIWAGGHLLFRRPADGLYFDPVYPLLSEEKDPDKAPGFAWPLFSDERISACRHEAKMLYETTDKAILGSFGGNIVELGQGLRGFANFFMDLAIDQDYACNLMDRMVETHIANLERYLDAVGEYIQVIQMGDDLGAQDRPQLSPQMYRDLIKPRHARVYQYVHEKAPQVKVFLHSCGSIKPLIPDLIEAGVDILNPVQIAAHDMDPAELKREFGKHLTFWGGGCDTQRILPLGSIDDIRREVTEKVNIFKPGGGFVFNQVHNIQADIPPEKVVAMYEQALESGRYDGAR